MLTLIFSDFDLFYVNLYSFYLQKLYKAIIQLKKQFYNYVALSTSNKTIS